MKLDVHRAILTLSLALAIAAAAAAQTADDIVAKYVTARGGMDKIEALKTVEVAAKAQQQGVEFPAKLEWKSPESLRMEFTVQGKTIVQAYDGKTAWMIMPLTGNTDPQKMSADDTKDLQETADFVEGPIINYKKKGNAVELLGKDDVEGSPAYKLKVTLKNGDITYAYIDADSGLEVKETAKVKKQGTEVEADSYFSDFRTVDGVMFPFSIENKMNGQTTMTFTIDSLKANGNLSDAVFQMPAASAAKKPQAK